MRIDILSLFPNMFQATMGESIIGKAQDNGFIDINVTDFRQYTTDKHNHVDDAIWWWSGDASSSATDF